MKSAVWRLDLLGFMSFKWSKLIFAKVNIFQGVNNLKTEKMTKIISSLNRFLVRVLFLSVTRYFKLMYLKVLMYYANKKQNKFFDRIGSCCESATPWGRVPGLPYWLANYCHLILVHLNYCFKNLLLIVLLF